ncbi:hypothetical protein E2C01_002035 [Portunus trituberculatus]|uniref:Uncharacterized protein n=1 Tax=Portunus trituberculatus TaxID=210409 RepID=A0A5B7CIA8_PORTR|nr:hypothetical protein [Portunus trituberculatus]
MRMDQVKFGNGGRQVRQRLGRTYRGLLPVYRVITDCTGATRFLEVGATQGCVVEATRTTEFVSLKTLRLRLAIKVPRAVESEFGGVVFLLMLSSACFLGMFVGHVVCAALPRTRVHIGWRRQSGVGA